MNNNVLSALHWKKSIRLKLFGSALLSFLITVVIVALFQHYFSDFTAILGYYMAYVPTTAGHILFLISFLVIFLFFFFLFLRGIVRYMFTLADGLMFIAGGDLGYRVPLSRQDELGHVARNINMMAERLQSMMERERQLEASKLELITSVSHDLRTPLTSLIGYLNLLNEDDYRDPDEHRRYIRNAYNKSLQLKKLIDDLFEYTRLTGGSVTLSLRTVDLGELVGQLIVEFEPLAQEQSLAIRIVKDPRPIQAQIDVEKFVRAFENLLMNALKFSLKPGEITVRLSERRDDLYLAVENRGKPITKEQERHLFDRFYKADPLRNEHRMPAGAGLGLSIAKNIVELHGGRIGLVHRDGHFVFYIELPRTTVPPSHDA